HRGGEVKGPRRGYERRLAPAGASGEAGSRQTRSYLIWGLAGEFSLAILGQARRALASSPFSRGMGMIGGQCAVITVGFDDSSPVGPSKRALLARNSWGPLA